MKLQRIPKWADMEAIAYFYDNCPEGYEVDHIIPLQGKKISGLHVAENLQWLTILENRIKGNSWDDDEWLYRNLCIALAKSRYDRYTPNSRH